MSDAFLTPEERAAMDALPREAAIPAGLEDRVIGGLRRARLIGRRRWPRFVAYAAASLVLFAAGLGAGAAIGRRSPPSGPRYLLLLYGAPAVTASEEQARVAEYSAWAGEERAAGRVLGGEKLGMARAVLGSGVAAPVDAGEPSGFFFISARSMDEAQAIADRCPHLRHGGTVVLRPIDETR